MENNEKHYINGILHVRVNGKIIHYQEFIIDRLKSLEESYKSINNKLDAILGTKKVYVVESDTLQPLWQNFKELYDLAGGDIIKMREILNNKA